MLVSPTLGALDADEAVSGLMAAHVLHGQLTTFYWGQAYGGSQEAVLTAGALALLGRGRIALSLVPIGLWAVAAVLVWRVGRRTIGEPRARVAAGLFWCSSAYFLWKSTRAHGFYGAGLVLGLWAMLAALRHVERPSRLDAASLGLALGLGWWATPQIAVLGLPALLWLAVRRRPKRAAAALAGATFLAGSLPWWIYNLRHHWASRTAAGGLHGGIVRHLHDLVSATLPTAVGLRLPFSLAWLLPVAAAAAAYALILAALAAAVVRRPRGTGLLLLAAGVFVPLYALSPFTWLTVEPRYLTPLLPVLALLLAAAATTAVRAAAIAAACIALAVAGLVSLDRHRVATVTENGVAVPSHFAPLLHTLERHGVTAVYANYWIAWRIDYESRERIAAAVPPGRLRLRAGAVRPLDTGLDPGSAGRWPPTLRRVEADSRPAYVFVSGQADEPAAARLLRRGGYTRTGTGGFDVWLAPLS